MGSRLHRLLPGLATAGVLAGLGVAALPILRVYDEEAARTYRPVAGPASVEEVQGHSVFLDPTTPPTGALVVDLKDNVSAADIADLNNRFGLRLAFNSVESEDDKLMRAALPSGVAASELLARLKADPRVEVAEPERIYSVPESLLQTVSADTPENPLTLVDGKTADIEISPAASVYLDASPQAPHWLSPWAMRAPEGAKYGINFTSALDDTLPRWRRYSFVPNDPRYKEQWNFRMIGAEEAWKRARGKGAVVAVIDTGVSIGPTKKGKACRDFGDTPFVEGYDFVNNDKDPFDDHGHGTHVAGTIAESTNNNEGVAGLAFEATIMPLKVLSASGSGSSGDIADAIRFAADKGANVINMSLGSAFPSDVIHKAVKYARSKGVVIVCAAGNSFREGVGYPAAYPECIAVSSVGPSGNLAKYSSWGKQVALAAPGGDMIDSGNAADGILQNTNYPESQGGNGDDYYAFQGTSMASPHVAGVAALIVGQGTKDPAKVREILTQTATPKNDAKKYGAGVLSASGATKKASGLASVKLRDMLIVGLGLLVFAVGGRRRSFGLRTAMFGALALGFFGPDWFTRLVGADNAWNLLGFSAFGPVLLYALLRGGRGVKVAGMLGIGIGVCLWANWHNGTIPFTAASFGAAPLLWTAANTAAAFGVAFAAARRAFRATNPTA